MKIWRLPLWILIVVLATSCSIRGFDNFSSGPRAGENAATSTSAKTRSDTCTKLFSDGFEGNGYLIAANLHPKQGESIKHGVIKVETGDLTDMYDNYIGFDVSPYGNALAYLDFMDDQMVLTVVSEKGVTEVPYKGLIQFIDWVNDYTIALKDNYEPQTYSLFLNLLTGEITRINTDFPDFYPNARELYRVWSVSIPAFDSSLNYAVYPSDLGFNFIRIKDRYVYRRIEVSPYMHMPEWSPGGDGFIIPVSPDISKPMTGELMRVSIDNTIDILTNFKADYPNFSINPYYKWSPDGEKIAFWLTEDSSLRSKSQYLTLIDLEKKNTMITCLSSQDYPLTFHNNLIWSPDGKQLAVQIYYGENHPTLIYLVDVEKLSYTIWENSKDLTPEGWLTFNPHRP